MKCFCCSGREYGDCCQPYIDLKMAADTAERLMRSRFSAFVQLNGEYLRQTWSKSQCPSDLDLDTKTKWIKLEVLTTENGQKEDHQGKVEFKAWFIHENQLITLHEISDFIRENKHWVYHSGQLFDEPVINLSMNQRCPCGSGKKYKRCCQSR